MKKALALLLLPLLLATPRPATAADRLARCVSVRDAAEITVSWAGRTERVHLIGVGAFPAAGQAFAEKARTFTSRYVLNKDVRLETDRQARDGSGALLAYVFLDDRAATFVNRDVIAHGYAQVADEGLNTRHARELWAAEASARGRHLALWGSRSAQSGGGGGIATDGVPRLAGAHGRPPGPGYWWNNQTHGWSNAHHDRARRSGQVSGPDGNRYWDNGRRQWVYGPHHWDSATRSWQPGAARSLRQVGETGDHDRARRGEQDDHDKGDRRD